MRITARDEGRQREFEIERLPDKCPMCNQGIEPIVAQLHHVLPQGHTLETVLICPHRNCKRLFIARYSRQVSGTFSLWMCVPSEPLNQPFSTELQQISPDFCAIYNQSSRAEKLGYTLVSGPGYRKALEFLMKDYLASLQDCEEGKKDVAALPLMAAIKKYVSDKRLLTTAERAAWLGNDETHYVRKWEGKDLQDLKDLIQLTCFWIQSEHLTKAIAATMPEGK